MALSNYSELQRSIARWLTRDDLGDVIPDFIALAEVRLNDRLRLAPMEKKATISRESLVNIDVLVDEDTGALLTDEGGGAFLTDEDADGSEGIPATLTTAPLPSDFLEMRALYADTNPKMIVKLAGPGWATYTYDGLSGYPAVYTIIGSEIGVHPITTFSLSMVYYAKIPALSDANPENWLLTQRPNLYLYASLIEAEPLVRDDGRIAVWKGLLDEGIADAVNSDIGTRWSNAGLTLSGPTP